MQPSTTSQLALLIIFHQGRTAFGSAVTQSPTPTPAFSPAEYIPWPGQQSQLIN